MEIPGRRQSGRPKRRITDVVRKDIQLVGVTEEEIEEMERWRIKICCCKA